MRARRHVRLQERRAQRRNEILEHASPVLGSDLGKIGQAGDPGILKPGRNLGRSPLGGAGRGALILPRGAGRWPGQRPLAPLPTLLECLGGRASLWRVRAVLPGHHGQKSFQAQTANAASLDSRVVPSNRMSNAETPWMSPKLCCNSTKRYLSVFLIHFSLS